MHKYSEQSHKVWRYWLWKWGRNGKESKTKGNGPVLYPKAAP